MKSKSPKGVWQKMVHGYQQFAKDKPGERFLKSYERWNNPDQSVWVNIAFVAAGVVLIVLGVLLGLVPGVPGVVLMVLGLALIATRFRWMAVGLDAAEVKSRKGLKKLKRYQKPVHEGLENAPTLPP